MADKKLKMIKSYEPNWEDRIEAKQDMKNLRGLGYMYGKDFWFRFDSFTQKNFLYFLEAI